MRRRGQEVAMLSNSGLVFALALPIPQDDVVSTMRESMREFCKTEKTFPAIHVTSCVLQADPRAQEMQLLLEEALRLADDAWKLGEAQLGMGIAVGAVSVARDNLLTGRKYRLSFDAAVMVCTGEAELPGIGVRVPEEHHDDAHAELLALGTRLMMDITARRSLKESLLGPVAQRAVQTLSCMGIPLESYGLCPAHM